eukprot:gene6515-8953_t
MSTLLSNSSNGHNRKLVGFSNFIRNNPKSDKFSIIGFHSIEIWCQDATNLSKRFIFGLGMNLVAKSDLTTGNKVYASYVVQSNDLRFIFTAPYSTTTDKSDSSQPHPKFDANEVNQFAAKHGVAVRSVCIKVLDAVEAYEISTKNGAIGVLAPSLLTDRETKTSSVISEIMLFNDTVIRWISGSYDGPAFPNYEIIPIPSGKLNSYGLYRIDHVVSNVPKLFEAVDYLMNAIGFHEFSEFTAEDVGTVDSGLNSMVLANNNEYVLLPVNEPTFGTKRKSQIQNYLEHNEGSGVQHIALKTDDIIATMREIRARSDYGGFDFMPSPNDDYYQRIPARIGENVLSLDEIKQIQGLGILVDKDDQGVLLQIFTKPIGDRPTLFFEIIQRIGCDKDAVTGTKVEQSAGCGGFGKGNFSELFKSIEEFEKSQEVIVKDP